MPSNCILVGGGGVSPMGCDCEQELRDVNQESLTGRRNPNTDTIFVIFFYRLLKKVIQIVLLSGLTMSVSCPRMRRPGSWMGRMVMETLPCTTWRCRTTLRWWRLWFAREQVCGLCIVTLSSCWFRVLAKELAVQYVWSQSPLMWSKTCAHITKYALSFGPTTL